MSVVAREIRKYMLSNYGNLISVGEPKFDETKKIWRAELKSDYPRIIRDDIDPEKRMLKFISLKGLGEIQLSEDLKIIEATPRDKCVVNLSSSLQMWLKRAERIIVSTTSEPLARVTAAKFMLTPIRMIVSDLLQRDFIEEEELKHDYRPPKIWQYLKLLEGLGLVERKRDGWSYGNLFTALRDKATNDEEFFINILSYVIKERYSILREGFRITILEPFVHVDTCYYAPSLEAEKLLFREERSIRFDYFSLYGKRPSIRIRHILDDLVRVGALQRKERYYYGNEELFSQMLDMKGQLEEIAPPSARRDVVNAV